MRITTSFRIKIALTLTFCLFIERSMNAVLKNMVSSMVNRVIYEYAPVAERENECLLNDFGLVGGKIVMINLDDRCEVERYMYEGVFIQTGDYVILSGREMPNSNLFWHEIVDTSGTCLEPYDPSIVALTDCFDSAVKALPCYNQPFFVLQGLETGFTTFTMKLKWGGATIRRVALKIYVNMIPDL